MGLGAKMMVGLVSLMLLVACMMALLNNIEGGNALLYNWGKSQKARIQREIILLGLEPGPGISREKAEYMHTMLDDGSGTRFFIFDKKGKNLLPGNMEKSEEAIVSAVATGNYKINRGFMIIPLPKDSDVSLNLQPENIGVNARVEIPDSDVVIVARSVYTEHVGALYRMMTGSVVVIITALIISLFFSRVSSRDITEPLHEIVNVAKKISEGELLEDVDIVTHDEMGLLAINFKAMVNNLRLMIMKIGGAAGSNACQVDLFFP